MLPGSWTGPDSVGLPSNDNGCEGVIKHRADAPQAFISLLLQTLAGAGCGGGGCDGGGGLAPTIWTLALRLCQLRW